MRQIRIFLNSQLSVMSYIYIYMCVCVCVCVCVPTLPNEQDMMQDPF